MWLSGLDGTVTARRVLRELDAWIRAEDLLLEMLITLVLSLVRDSEDQGSLMSPRSAGGNALGRGFFGRFPESWATKRFHFGGGVSVG